MRFEVFQSPIPGLISIQRKAIGDFRGTFSRFFCSEDLKQSGFLKPILQINHSFTHKKGSIRGMHFQYPPFADMKMVSCVRGEVFDVVIDLRRNSKTYLQWYGEVLSEENKKSLIIPEGFAHGFQTLTDDCEMFYLHTEKYSPEFEGAINAIDPRINIQWPIPITEISEKDKNHAFIQADYQGILI